MKPVNILRPLAALATCLVLLPQAHAGGPSADLPARLAAQSDGDTTDRFIVNLRNPGQGDPRSRIAGIGRATGERLTQVRAMSGNAHVVRLARRVGLAEARAVARLLATDAEVESIEPDVKLYPQLVPNDTLYQQQWDLYEATAGINAPAAWDVTTGSSSIAVAVIDSGILPHAELAPRLLPGYDFIADTTVSNDGDGRDSNASDPGDHGCNGSTSSWHGTHVAGTIAATGHNGTGMAGINWVSKLVPVRVLGRCGGYLSDFIDGMRWSAGIAVTGIATNPNPVRVQNISAGGGGTCSTAMQRAVNDVVAKGVVVVVAAGNSGVDAAGTTPANCSGVVTVGAVNRDGSRASYSNYGSKVAISAPGGPILSTLNTGTSSPVGDSYGHYQGTSMATPHVTGVVSLLLSAQPSLTPAQVLARLQQTARVFPTGTSSDCSTALCGAGIVDAGRALGGGGTPPTVTWTTIAYEGESFSVSGTQTVRYGAGSSWITRSMSGSGQCTNAFFGSDPAYAIVKQCQLAGTGTTTTPTTPTTWTRIAGEGETFTVSGTKTVRYGAGTSWVSVSVTGTGQCSNAFFGSDPAWGQVKQCEVGG